MVHGILGIRPPAGKECEAWISRIPWTRIPAYPHMINERLTPENNKMRQLWRSNTCLDQGMKALFDHTALARIRPRLLAKRSKRPKRLVHHRAQMAAG